MEFSTLEPWIADALVVIGVAVMTMGVYGIFRMPDVYLQLHAASKSVFLGVIVLAVATGVTEQRAIIYRVVLISAVLLLTTPVASHSIAYAARLRGAELAPEETFSDVDDRQPKRAANLDGARRPSEG